MSKGTDKEKGGAKPPIPKLTEKAYIATQDFRDVNIYEKIYKKGEYVEGFDHDRIQKAIENELIKEVTREV